MRAGRPDRCADAPKVTPAVVNIAVEIKKA
jgi:hypothetical protein